MTRTGNSKRLFIDAFILAGIAVIIVSAYLLTDLFDRPLAKRSEGLKRASIKWEQLKGTTGSPLNDLPESAALENALARPEPAMQQEALPAEPSSDPLPVLTGILQVAGISKDPGFIAIMEGKRLKKQDKIRDFTVDSITAKGVVLAKNGRTWFIPEPNIFFSLSRKEEPAEGESR